jgi:hypothetical protein
MRFEVPIKPDECKEVVEDARLLIESTEDTSPSDLASPGATCTICDFRPWCQPFWQWQDRPMSDMEALETGRLGFQSEIKVMREVDNYWKLTLAWAKREVALVAPLERFPHLKSTREDDKVRVLDAHLEGLRHRPRAIVTEYTEVYLLN